MDFGERIESIKGTRDRCTIPFSNGRVLVCYGELLVHGFCIYKSSLNLTSEEVNKLQELIEQKSAGVENPMKITIE